MCTSNEPNDNLLWISHKLLNHPGPQHLGADLAHKVCSALIHSDLLIWCGHWAGL
jgi:hypothetical protein